MISLQHLLQNPQIYKDELKKRFKHDVVDQILQIHQAFKPKQQELENLRQQKNEFNDLVISLQGEEKLTKINEMKSVSEQIKTLENTVRELTQNMDKMVAKIPNLSSNKTSIGKDDTENPVIKTNGKKPEFNFEPKPYWELEVYKKYVGSAEGAKAMGSRGFYLLGEMARFRKVLFDWAEDFILQKGFEMMYVPLLLNEKVLTEIGNLPDFDGQLYEVPISENKNYYLIPSSEQSMMAFWAGKHIGELEKPLLMMANTTCFRKEAGSYGKDQQGILRTHQFEKIEIDAIYRPEDEEKVFDFMSAVCEEMYNLLGIHYQAVEVCSGDLPFKHHRQIDYNAYFPGVDQFREICSNGSATNYQNRGLKIRYSENLIPHSNNCTGMVFRTGLAILEQFQDESGRVKIPQVLVKRFGKEWLE